MKIVGGNYFTVGLDDNHKPIVHKVMFYEHIRVGQVTPAIGGKWTQRDCVVLSEGIEIITDSTKLFRNASDIQLSSD